MSTEISLSGCRQHNLRNIDVSLPSRGLTLITGPSGSGKSSLAFATLHAESRRRYLESLSTSERSRFDHISPPDLDDAVHLPLTIAIQPETLSSGSRNTFGTATGIVSVLQMLFASRSECDCPDCGASIRVWETQEIIESLTELPAGTRLQIGFSLQQTLSGADAISWLQTAGFQRVIHQGKVYPLSDLSDVKSLNGLVVVVDRIKTGSTNEARLRESLEVCFRAGQGKCIVFADSLSSESSTNLEWQSIELDDAPWFQRIYSRERDCLNCGRSVMSPELALFRWSSPLGACPECRGRGSIKANRKKKIGKTTCKKCEGARLNSDALAYRLSGKTLPELHSMTVFEFQDWVNDHRLEELHVSELLRRLELLSDIGFGAFPLKSEISSMTAVERTSLAIASATVEPLAGALYILEEPYSGHPRDDWSKVDQLISLILNSGAGVCLVQAQEEPVTHSPLLTLDHILQLGPGSGDEGGTIVDAPAEIAVVPPHQPRDVERTTLNDVEWPWSQQTELEFSVGGITILSGSLATRPISLMRDCLLPKFSELAEGDSSPFQNVESLAVETRKPHPRQTVLSAIQAFSAVRQLFAETDDAKKRNLGAGDFSLHKKDGGRCTRCEGTGQVAVELDFLAEFELPCPECEGTRYEPRVNEVRFRGYTLPEIMNLTASEAFRAFKGEHRIQKRLQLLKQVRLGYLRLGQSLTQMSRGERQRLRLAATLAKTDGTKHLVVIEELSNGLSAAELPSLVSVLRDFTTAGHSLFLVDANDDWEKYSDIFQKLTPRK